MDIVVPLKIHDYFHDVQIEQIRSEWNKWTVKSLLTSVDVFNLFRNTTSHNPCVRFYYSTTQHKNLMLVYVIHALLPLWHEFSSSFYINHFATLSYNFCLIFSYKYIEIQVCIPVGCVPPADWPYYLGEGVCLVRGVCLARGSALLGVCLARRVDPHRWTEGCFATWMVIKERKKICFIVFTVCG